MYLFEYILLKINMIPEIYFFFFFFFFIFVFFFFFRRLLKGGCQVSLKVQYRHLLGPVIQYKEKTQTKFSQYSSFF